MGKYVGNEKNWKPDCTQQESNFGHLSDSITTRLQSKVIFKIICIFKTIKLSSRKEGRKDLKGSLKLENNSSSFFEVN